MSPVPTARVLSVTAAAALVLLSLAVRASDAAEARFDVGRADLKLSQGVWLVDADVELVMSAEAEAALRSGLTLFIEMQMRVTRQRRWWPDAGIADVKQGFYLSYHVLSQRFVVRSRNSGQQESFPSLAAALESVGTVRDFPLIDATLLEGGAIYYASLRAVLDEDRLPNPLRLLAFWQDDFSLESEWYRWPLSS